MDDYDQLETIEKKFAQNFSSKVLSMNPVDFAFATNTENNLPSQVDLHQSKMHLLEILDKPLPVPEPYSYSQKMLDQLTKSIDLPADNARSLANFYTAEIDRVLEKYNIITKRCRSRQRDLVDIIPQLSLIVEEFSAYIMDCKEAVSRLGPSTLTAFTYMDIKKEVNQMFYNHSQLALINSIIRSIEMFPITRRRNIYEFFVNTASEMYSKDKTARCISPFYTSEELINQHIHKIAKIYNIDQDIDINDGQSFTYTCDKLFYLIWKKLELNDIPRKDIEVPTPIMHLKPHQLAHTYIFATLPIDHKIASIFEKITTYEDHEIIYNAKEQASFYDSFVGMGLLNKRLEIPQYKIYVWLELRWLHMKFLWEYFVHYINYFQYIRYKLANPTTNLYVKQSDKFKEFIEVCDENGPFIFKSTDKICEDYVSKFSRICGFFINKTDIDKKLIDKELAALEILELEVQLCAAKYSLIAPLLEILEHKKDDTIINLIHTTINAIPVIDISLAHSFTFPYSILIDTIQLQAKITRKLINSQILHLRQIAERMNSEIPIFDKPHLIPCPFKIVYQSGSIGISPFEVYESLGEIGKIFNILPKLIPEFLESANIKVDKFYPYMSYSIWHELDQIVTESITHGVFPYDNMPMNFPLQLSDAAISLFSSPFLSSLQPLEKLLNEMNDSRKTRVLLSTRRLFNFAWNLQTEILKTIDLQKSYLAQCKALSTTDITVQLAPFTSLQNGSVDSMPEDIVEFALYEFNPTYVDFTSITFIKDLLFSGDFIEIDDLYKAQKQQNMYLETAVRYNDFMLDNNQFAELFCFESQQDDNANLFVTVTDNTNETLENEARIYSKQIVAALIFYEASSIRQNLQIFEKDKTHFQLNIKKIKQDVRKNLSTHLKHMPKNSSESRSLYFSEMIDAFSSYLYRIEIARVCDSERRLFLTNSFIDTFVLGPVDGQRFVNEAGRFENFFYVPTWIEVFTMMRSSGLPRQSAVLKWVVPFVIARLRIVSYVRYTACLEQSIESIFETMAVQQMNVETTAFQKLLNEFQRMPNARDIDVLADFTQNKFVYYMRLFEYTLLQSFDSCFILMKSELSSNSMQKHFTASGAKELKYGEVLKELYVDIHKPLPTDTFSTQRYIPNWLNEFAFRFQMDDKQNFSKELVESETFLETSLQAFKMQSYLDNFQMVQPMAQFAENCIARNLLKYAYFQVLAQVDYRQITPITAVTGINQKQYLNGYHIWIDIILKEAMQKITPIGEPVYKKVPKDGMPKYVKMTIEVIVDHFDTAISDMQAKQIQNQSSQILSGLNVSKKSLEEMIPETFVLTLHRPSKEEFLITPKEANKQFQEEIDYTKADLLHKLNNIILDAKKDTISYSTSPSATGTPISTSRSIQKAQTAETGRRRKDITYILNEDVLKTECANLSSLFSNFINSSLRDEIVTWKQYNLTAINLLRQKIQRDDAIEIVHKYILDRHHANTATQVGFIYENKILKINELEDIKRKIVHRMTATNHEIEMSIRSEYDGLVNDLHKRIEEEQNTFIEKKRMIYRTILKILKKDYSLDDSSLNSSHNIGGTPEKNQKILEKVQEEDRELKKKVKILRIIRTLKLIAMQKSFERKLTAAESDRKSVNASLWSNRLSYEMHGLEMEEQLQQAVDKLCECELNLVATKHTLKAQKSQNIDMVQWKATNANKIVDLKKEIDKVKLSKESPNIGQLLKKLEVAQDTLDALIEETDAIDAERERTISVTQKKIDKVRTSVEQTRISRTYILENSSFGKSFVDDSAEKQAKIQAIREENALLKNTNEQMAREIQYYTEYMQKQSNTTKSYLEKSLTNVIRPKTSIIKPTASTTKVMSRSANSRIDTPKKKLLPKVFI